MCRISVYLTLAVIFFFGAVVHGAQGEEKKLIFVGSEAFVGPLESDSTETLLKCMVFAKKHWVFTHSDRSFVVIVNEPPGGSAANIDVIVYVRQSQDAKYFRKSSTGLHCKSSLKATFSSKGRIKLVTEDNDFLFELDTDYL